MGGTCVVETKTASTARRTAVSRSVVPSTKHLSRMRSRSWVDAASPRECTRVSALQQHRAAARRVLAALFDRKRTTCLAIAKAYGQAQRQARVIAGVVAVPSNDACSGLQRYRPLDHPLYDRMQRPELETAEQVEGQVPPELIRRNVTPLGHVADKNLSRSHQRIAQQIQHVLYTIKFDWNLLVCDDSPRHCPAADLAAPTWAAPPRAARSPRAPASPVPCGCPGPVLTHSARQREDAASWYTRLIAITASQPSQPSQPAPVRRKK